MPRDNTHLLCGWLEGVYGGVLIQQSPHCKKLSSDQEICLLYIVDVATSLMRLNSVCTRGDLPHIDIRKDSVTPLSHIEMGYVLSL